VLINTAYCLPFFLSLSCTKCLHDLMVLTCTIWTQITIDTSQCFSGFSQRDLSLHSSTHIICLIRIYEFINACSRRVQGLNQHVNKDDIISFISCCMCLPRFSSVERIFGQQYVNCRNLSHYCMCLPRFSSVERIFGQQYVNCRNLSHYYQWVKFLQLWFPELFNPASH